MLLETNTLKEKRLSGQEGTLETILSDFVIIWVENEAQRCTGGTVASFKV